MGTNNVTLEDVLLHVHELEERVAALERLVAQAPAPANVAEPTRALPQPPSLSFSGVQFATIAKALLAFGGAYLLRAIAESGFIAQPIGIAAGLLYALVWLVWSTRSRTFLYGLTSALIFAGLVWENAVEIHTLGGSLAAMLTVLFCLAAMVLAWRRDLAGIATIATAVCASVALLLLIATHDVVPFAVALLAIGAASEFAATRGRRVNHWMRYRWFPALAADLGVAIVVWVITRPQGVPESYRPFGMTSVVALSIALVLVYVLSLGYRTLALGDDISTFEIAQNVTTIALFIWGCVVMGREAPAARFVVEAFCLFAGAGCYATAVLFLRPKSRQRNFLMYGIFGLALVMAGISILLSGTALVAMWCILAFLAAWLGTHEHVPVYLAAAVLASLSGTIPMALTTIALVLCYWMAGDGPADRARIPAFLIAAMLCWSILRLGGDAITQGLGASAFTSTLRTALLCAIALGLARLRVRRGELLWVLYPLMLFGAWRLLAEDFPQGRPTSLALSLLLYGGTLLQLTRMIRA